MNRGDLVSQISADAGITKTQAQAALNSFISSTSAALQSGDKVTLVGFGTFATATRTERKGRNPQTGKEINIPAKTVVKFKAGKELNQSV